MNDLQRQFVGHPSSCVSRSTTFAGFRRLLCQCQTCQQLPVLFKHCRVQMCGANSCTIDWQQIWLNNFQMHYLSDMAHVLCACISTCTCLAMHAQRLPTDCYPVYVILRVSAHCYHTWYHVQCSKHASTSIYTYYTIQYQLHQQGHTPCQLLRWGYIDPISSRSHVSTCRNR